MKANQRRYGIPFFKLTIPFMNDDEECIGKIHIRSKTAEPLNTINGIHYFMDIDNELYKFPVEHQWTNHGPANEKEQNELYG